MLRVEGLRKSYPGFGLSVSLEVAPGRTLALLGPSGSGKSTLLRLIAGLEAPEAGAVWLGDRDIGGLPPEGRRVGFVFQDYALFPHLSVAENVAFGLREARWEAALIRARVAELLGLTRLGPHAHKRPHQLSGGERQRVALARALANLPGVLLLDEPLGALDLRLRQELLFELRDILRQTPIPSIVVTHDQAEAFVIAEQVAVMRAGRVEQQGTPEALYGRPRNAWVAAFLGHRNILSAEQSARLGLPARPHLLPQDAIQPGRGEGALVAERVFLGARVSLELALGDLRLRWEGPDPGLRQGDAARVGVDWARAVELES